MKSFIAALRSLVLPYGRTTGSRIVLDGVNGKIQIYDQNDLLIVEIAPDVDGGGVWTRGTQLPYNLSAFLGGGELRFQPVIDNIVSDSGIVFFDSDGATFTDLVLESGAVDVTDRMARLVLESSQGGVARGVVYIYGRGADVADLEVTGDLRVGTTTWSSYTPGIAGHGTATFSSRIGYYYRLGGLVFVTVHIVVLAAGSGATPVMIDLPTIPSRTGGIRQIIPVHVDGTASRAGVALILAGGSGVTIDRLRVQNAGAVDNLSNFNGVDLTAGTVITMTGTYRE